jgi:hypothetical protein
MMSVLSVHLFLVTVSFLFVALWSPQTHTHSLPIEVLIPLLLVSCPPLGYGYIICVLIICPHAGLLKCMEQADATLRTVAFTNFNFCIQVRPVSKICCLMWRQGCSSRVLLWWQVFR